MSVEVRVTLNDPANVSSLVALSRKVVDGPIVIALVGANGQQLSASLDPVEFIHCVKALYPELSIQ